MKPTYWRNEITQYEKIAEKWEQRGKRVIQRYLDERKMDENGLEAARSSRFNILWANVETIFPAVYAKSPKPEVMRRFNDRDPAGRVASMMLERCLDFEIEKYPDFDAGIRNSLLDRLLPGRGVAWIRYEPTFGHGETISEDEKPEEYVAHECSPVDYIHWAEFGHCIARTWEEVPALWRKVYLTKEQVKDRFGDLAKKQGYKISDIPVDCVPEQYKDTEEGRQFKRACIYEIWSKKDKKVYWYNKNIDVYLDEKDDPLKLDEFWPCPKPLYATTGTGTLIPVPDFAMYQDQARELDIVTDRIDNLTNAVKVVGVYDASQDGVKRMLNEGVNNTLIPVDTWAMFAEKGGIKGVVDWLPLDQVVKALDSLYIAREQIKSVIYELTGLSDIIRGSSDPRETLGAQQLKSQYGSLRIRKLQNTLAEFARSLLRIKAEIICNFYSDETIVQMSGAMMMQKEDIEHIPQALVLLRDSVTRDFRIDIQTDSMVEMDRQAEQEARVEFLTATGAFLEKALPVIEAVPEMGNLLGEMLMFGVRGFRAGRNLEGVFDETVEKIKKAPPKPNPEDQAAQVEAQAEQQRNQMEMQKTQMDIQAKQQDAQSKMAQEQMKLQLERERLQVAQEQIAMELEVTREEHRMKMELLEAQHQAKMKEAKQSKSDD